MEPETEALLLTWCRSAVGDCTWTDPDVRIHGRSTVWRLQTSRGPCFLKIHADRAAWEREVHAYERWSPALGAMAPRLIAARAESPFALLLSALPGSPAIRTTLDASRQTALWRAAGRTLAELHASARHPQFGFCRHDGTLAEPAFGDAVEALTAAFQRNRRAAHQQNLVNAREMATVVAAQHRCAAFAGEPAVPCHRDYNTENWLVDAAGAFVGVIDFEMSAWQPRVIDLCRYPHWEWLHQPQWIDALLEGYGWQLAAQEREQLHVGRVLYAIEAIVWGTQAGFNGFVREGHAALQHLQAES